jgi:hypothetical protein
MTPEQTTYISSLTWKQLLTTFDALLTEGKVDRGDWYAWRKTWVEAQRTTRIRSTNQQAHEVFRTSLDTDHAAPAR